MAKFDVEAAYRNVPIHLSDHVLLGIKWHAEFYIDLVLPFGLRSAPLQTWCSGLSQDNLHEIVTFI